MPTVYFDDLVLSCVSTTTVDFAFAPGTLNLRSAGRGVQGAMTPAAPLTAADIDVSSMRVNGVAVDPGQECVCDKSEMLEFSRRNDPWPFHVDEAAAALSPYGGIVASGGYIVTLWYRSLVEIYNTPRATWAFLGGLDWKLRFRAPVRAADTLRARVTVKDKRPWIKPDRGAVTLFNEILNQRSEVVCTVEVTALLAIRAGSAAAVS